MDLNNLKIILKDEPSYRYRQVEKAIYKDLINDWAEATNLPKNLRQKLNHECPLAINGEIFKSKDNKTIKAVISLADGKKIESVLMRHRGGRNSICVSSQVGCLLGCQFCATGAMGYKRNLNKSEIIEQFLFLARYLNKINPLEKISNVIFMGMGEPFLNYENVLGAIYDINDQNKIGLGARHISISTAGIIDGIKKLAKEKLQINLAISLHAPDDKLRSELMPINKRYPLPKLLAAVDNYIIKTSRRVMFEYLLIDNINDTFTQSKKLAVLMKKPLYLVNLISYNPTGKFEPSSREAIKKFRNILEKEGVAVTQRNSLGQDINAACGQLAQI
ncbi:23S rRNA (adenine(2503)-C(2))-methyltransferase RlmN [Candidatus Falkowbacteria bacterium CG_4_9_14_3_um_filter_36_9]|uniref:Probable dual-specificity RNA methyltransferase RlmN n=1 Tax=Candidatus Falkowbacteria bacterium CG02_land_8_20_14_3_00_36_14 TaxID=1974560 RepID=A0A2M7DQD3_9BACT|nr:MAG: 23S rRNA (adenine(2503)-C(2))-methyltransferase RlmN [Candidatus Falkowbacteria bacterium CG02_land_8_20_14_3_00_36_14]PJA11305.1 MAG: 23S rRNA (adenine(2503)-C(2))-methyltransferase RlmN [Candidatus Falkowbacteria bacterium CG_4_10_14_0_2_um_filter_36_22]PJB20758.1 MAG: 23S rRNA (adenine(2503)-C(2))-methyltransferase RlmN [Candidatus Falkowbacteria bacterium CG_4_9_14_3_um_filter_36_9]